MTITINGTTGITNPSGGTVLDTTSDLGWGQTWQDVRASRVVGTSYQNTTGKPIQVIITHFGNYGTIQVSSNNSTWIDVGYLGGSGAYSAGASFVVPNNYYYRQSGGTLASVWAELR